MSALQSVSSVTGLSETQHPIGGKYRLQERLGEGALGVVYRAVHLGLEKSFALKLLKTSGAPAALARFSREALALGRLQHPHIVGVTDSGIDESSGAPYLVMELLEGEPLSDLCRDHGPLPLARAFPLLKQIAAAVDAAHGAGVLHRDLKPGNILVDTNQDPPRVKVLDFGLAELLATPGKAGAASHPNAQAPAGPTTTDPLHGTPLYAAPELIRHGEASRASDIYSVGVIAYELLGGTPPFQGSMPEVLAGHLRAEPPPLPLPPPVWRALRKPLQKDPALRPRTAGEIVRGLRAASLETERARWKATEVPRRLGMAALLAASLVALGLALPWPPIPTLERWIGDLRLRTAPAKDPDPRILLITLDEASLDSSPRPLADRADEIGRGLSRIFEAGARGVAINLLPPAQWSRSKSFSDLILRHPEDLTLAAFSAPDGTLVGTECLDGLTMAALGPRRAADLFGFVNLDEDRDGVVRRSRLWFRDVAGHRRSSWAARAARELGSDIGTNNGRAREFWIDTRTDWPRYARISWRQVPLALDRSPGLFRNRLVLVGGDFRGSGDDYYRIVHRSRKNTAVSGLTLRALMVDTIEAGMPIREPGRGPILIAAALAAVLAMAGNPLYTPIRPHRDRPRRRSRRLSGSLLSALLADGPEASGHGSPAPRLARVSRRARLAAEPLFTAGGLSIMNVPRKTRLGALVALTLCPAAAMARVGAHEPAAIVYSMAGKASLAAPGAAPRRLSLYDRLPAGTTVHVGPNSRLALAFVTGRRYEISGPARASLGKSDLARRSGAVRRLASFPRLPPLAPIAEDDHPGSKAGAVRIRREEIETLCPRDGAATLAGATVLGFQATGDATRYEVEIEDARGVVSFRTVTEASTVKVPAGILAPGARYHWAVTAVDRPGPTIRGETDFVTLARRTADARERLRQAVEAAGDADARALLTAVDHHLGLASESCAGQSADRVAADRETPASRPVQSFSAAPAPAAFTRQAAATSRCSFSEPGLVIETIAPESAGLRTGLMPGDRLFSWCRAPSGKGGCVARGVFRTPFDLWDVEIEEAQRGGVVVAGARGSENLQWSLLPTYHGLTVAPLLHGALAKAYQDSREREQSGDPASAAMELERAAELASENHCTDVELWLRDQAARQHARARQWSAVDAGYQAALAKARARKAARAETHLHMSWWAALWERGELAQAKQEIEKALRLEERKNPEGLLLAQVLIKLTATADKQDNLDEADRFARRAYDLALRTAPGSGIEVSTANNLAAATATRGDLAQAELYIARALAIQEKLAPAGEGIVMNLWNYGELLLSRGDFAGAEAALLRAKRIIEKIEPVSMALATTWHLLGETADQRGDHEAAESFFRRQLALLEKLEPSGSSTRDRLVDLARLALLQHQGGKAEELWQQALAISERLNPKGPKSASCLVGLAEATRLQGRVSEAEQLLQRALAIWQEINPEAFETGSIHLKLGVLLLERDDAEAAEDHLRETIRIGEKHGYRGLLPESYQALARLQARRGQLEGAAASYLAAADALEAQRTRLGGAQESQWLYGSSLGDLYFEAAEHQIALARPQEAWKLIERGRARGFQELLAQKDLRFAAELPAGLYAERHRLAAEYDHTLAALAEWMPEQGSEKRETLEGRLRDLRLEQADVQERIRSSSPRLAALESPTPLDLAAARSALDPGTVLLTFAIGDARSFLFVIESAAAPGSGFSFYPLSAGRETLAKEIESFRSLLGRPHTDLAALKERGRRLYDLLIRPAEPVVAKADRWLISPDGPLHSLPFAALVAGGRYLAESKPIHIAASAAVYQEIRAARAEKPSATMEFFAVGDPLYPKRPGSPADTAEDPQLQTALRRGLQLKPLPATRGEVESISHLFSGARALLGRDATEEAIKSLAPQARRLHFACHGLLDERFPLNSGLALSIPEHPEEGRDNGLLQAWEIFDELRLDADLVTLSACDSGLGKEMGGEGLVGLVRAFQFAGARSVLASLWSISDVSTARFMKRFYGYLRNGKSKDEALRAAQIDQIRGKSGSSHPFHWAAFELFGDWR